MSSSLWPFRCPAEHETIGAIIRRRSTNRTDVREAALAGLDLSGVRRVLDLGCGFGFMSEAVARRVAPDACLAGVDLWADNERPYLDRVAATGRRGSFYCAQVGAKFPCPDRHYDLVVCSYSLYFFVDALPEVARVLAPDGLFLAITHSRCGFVSLLPLVGLADDDSELPALAQQFSAENGHGVLSEWFSHVERIHYHNTLRFEPRHLDELLEYLEFKLPYLVAGAQPGDRLPEAVARTVAEALRCQGELVLEKTDAVFRCRGPRCR